MFCPFSKVPICEEGKANTWLVRRYDVALLYLEQANYDLELAIDVYKDDERWEKENPLQGKGKGKAKTRSEVGRRRFTGQKS